MNRNKLSDKIEKSKDGRTLTVSDLDVANKILYTIPDLVFIVSKDGEMYYVKADSEGELAFPVNEIIGRNLSDLPFSNELLELFLSRIKKCVSEQIPVTFQYSLTMPNLTGHYEGRVIPYEKDNVMVIIRNRTKEEEALSLLIEREKLLRHTNEQLLSERNRFLKLNEDYERTNKYLNQKKQEVENLFSQNLYNERILNQVLENSPNGIFTYDPDLNIMMMNPVMLQSMLAEKEDLVGKNLSLFIQDEELINVIRTAIDGKSGFFQGWYRSKRTPLSFYGQVKTFPLYDEEKPDKVIGGTAIVTNLTDWKMASDSLQEREENLLVTLNSIGDGVIVTDENGIVKLLNPVAQRITGYQNNEAISRDIDEIFNIYNSENSQKVEKYVKDVLSTGAVYNMSQRLYLVSVTGEKYQISVTVSPIRNKDNSLSGVVIVFQDISESHRLFQRIALSEVRQKTLVQNSPLGVLLIHENGQILEINQSAVKMLGSPSEEATRKINVLNFKPLEKAGFKEDFLNCIRTRSQVEAERKYLTKWGKEICVKYFFNAIILPDTEERGVLCSLVDITDQKMAEEREIIYTNSLKHLSDTAISFVELAESDDPFFIIGNKLRELSSLPFVLMKRSEDGHQYEVAHFSLPQEVIETLSHIGTDLRSLTVPSSAVQERTISRYFQKIKPDFENYIYNFWSGLKETYNKLNPAEVYTIDFIWEAKDFGNATFFVSANDDPKNIQVIETFVNQAALLLQKRETAIRLRQSNDLYLTSVNAIADFFFIVDVRFDFVIVNTAFQNLLSRISKSQDVIGKNLFDVFPFLNSNIKKQYTKVSSSLKPDSNRYELKIKGFSMFIDSNSVPIVENGVLRYIITTFKDITAQTRYEKQIRELKEFNEKIIESIKDGIAVINDNNVIKFTNPAFDRMLGVKHGSNVGRKWTELIADIPIDDFSSPVLNERTSLVRTEVTLRKGNNEILSALITISPAAREKGTYILLATDITERKKMESDILKAKEKAEESDRLKTAFLSNMSHEIRTPLNSIIGFSYLLQNREIPAAKQKVYLNQITSSSQMLLRLIQDIIDISKIEAGQLSIEISVFDLKELMNELIQHFTNEIIEAKKEIVLVCSNKEMSQIYKSDYIRIKQVLSNLINNSIKFTDEGKIEFGYSISDKLITFYVSDTGIGIKNENKNLLFQRFSRVGGRFDQSVKGTGLGLAICKNIVELMGGTIEFKSVFKQGTTFTFTLPFTEVSERSVQRSDNVKLPELSIGEQTILIAEDDDVNYMFIQEFLSEYNVKIIRAYNGEEAVDFFLKGSEVTLILMDLQMPIMDGIEATRKIREINTEIPIIAQTAYAFSSERKACIEAGCNDYISKPIVQDELLDKIKKYSIVNNKKAR